METVQLKNGAEEAVPLVNVTMMSLRKLFDELPIVLYELVMLCRDSNHKPFGNCAKDLLDLNLIGPSNRPHNSIRNIVLSAVSGDGLDMTLGSPVATKEITA